MNEYYEAKSAKALAVDGHMLYAGPPEELCIRTVWFMQKRERELDRRENLREGKKKVLMK